MRAMQLATITGTVIAALTLGCSASTDSTDGAPSVDLGGTSPQDEGTSYNGWTQAPTGNITNYWYPWGDFAGMALDQVGGTWTRSSGDSTRGGGTCIVLKRNGSSCSTDSTCVTAAVQTYGLSAYGYCYQGACYDRPGDAASFCSQNPNRSPGTFVTYINADPMQFLDQDHDSYYSLGCMTKTAGPNTGCGGTNTSVYMRTIGGVNSSNYYY